MIGTTLTMEYERVRDTFGYDDRAMARFASASVDASWGRASIKGDLTRRSRAGSEIVDRGLSCYSMLMFSERLQVLIRSAQRERLEREAARRGASVATLVREAIDQTFPPSDVNRATAASRLLGAELMEVPDIDELLDELDRVRGRRS